MLTVGALKVVSSGIVAPVVLCSEKFFFPKPDWRNTHESYFSLIASHLTHRDDAVQTLQCFAKITLLVSLGISPAVVRAGLDPDGQREVAALLAFVGQSHCTFIRNGKAYNSVDARNHLESKLNYLLRQDKVNSAEEFIDRAGTESSLSGKPYVVSCDGKEQPSADWLKEELRLLRKMQP